MLLINKTEIAKHREISTSVRDEKINPFISDAQKLDLKPLLGDELYFDLVYKFEQSDDISDLMEPLNYEHNGKRYSHEGLNKVLSIFTNARYVLGGGKTDSPFGLVEKNFQDGTQVSQSSKRDTYKMDRQAATDYFAEVALFLTRNADTYPLWLSGCKKRGLRGGMRLSKITSDD